MSLFSLCIFLMHFQSISFKVQSRESKDVSSCYCCTAGYFGPFLRLYPLLYTARLLQGSVIVKGS